MVIQHHLKPELSTESVQIAKQYLKLNMLLFLCLLRTFLVAFSLFILNNAADEEFLKHGERDLWFRQSYCSLNNASDVVVSQTATSSKSWMMLVFLTFLESVAEGQAVSEFVDTTELELSSTEIDAAKTLHRNNELLSQQVEPLTSISSTSNLFPHVGKDCFSTDDGLSSADYSDDSDIEIPHAMYLYKTDRKKENEVEISRLKFMLHQMEL
ncbi:hypothetical protein POM88_045682 [Heracleum sosnowskyi]|uniref:Uncharacterized protein n=1 Tax=Heracleum sosnowskyi TaxID=360622 RepID=A0AAD8H6Z1_9APIA|nr:hypothetical protein POM88_045682 [Heracleum sosnowskyi]